MRSRIETLLGVPSGAMWLGTFHGIAHRLLRIHWREVGLPQSFQILDSEDQARVLRKVLKALDLDETRWIPREILNRRLNRVGIVVDTDHVAGAKYAGGNRQNAGPGANIHHVGSSQIEFLQRTET